MGAEPHDSGEAGAITIVALDSCHYPSPPKKSTFVFGPSDSFSTLRKKFAEKTGYRSDSFDIFHQGKRVADEEKSFQDLGVVEKILINIGRASSAKETDFGPKDLQLSGSKGSPSNGSPPSTSSTSSAIIVYPEPAGAPPGYSSSSYSSSSYSSSYSYSDWNKKSKSGYVGLSNQGATCYMNSLIQTLYMTPEFRTALYKWDFNETYKKWRETEKQKGDKPEMNDEVAKLSPEDLEEHIRVNREKESIPRQLQLLFTRLQLRDQKAVKTKDLTNSFGWKESDAFTQHDVQELCRVLFDALEKVLKGTEQENLINDLYQGEMQDYVKCKKCGHESSRTDKYLDIPLVIRGFGSTTPVKSVEEALEKFIQPEVLEGENQYHCEECKTKVDASKGLKFSSFPYLLTLQLKRFDFDYDTFRRIKLNDKVTFPPYLDLNRFINSTGKQDPKEEEEDDDDDDDKEEGEDQDESMMETKEGAPVLDDEFTQKKRKLGMEEGDDEVEEDNEDKMEDEVAGKSSKDEESDGETKKNGKVESWLKNGPYVYELFSVLIHRGSALGGHYYAYIKSFTSNKWFEFNDSQVSEITENEIRKTFGEDAEERPRSGMYSSMFHSSANAYMLMYRRVDPKRNVPDVVVEDIPLGLKKKVLEENEKYKRKIEEKERERETVKLKVHYEQQPEQLLKVHQSTTLAETLRLAADLVGASKSFPPDCIRLRSYQQYNELPAEPLDDPEQLNKSLEQLGYVGTKSIMVETKEPGTSFPEYNALDVQIRVIRYDRHQNKFLEPIPVTVHRDATLADLKKELQTKFGIPADHQRIVRETWTYSGPPAKILEGDDELLRSEHRVYEGSKVYVEYCENLESESPSFAEIERTRNLIELKYNLPGSEECSRSVQVSKKITYGELKRMLQPIVNMELNNFKVSRGNIHWKMELKNESDTLEDCRLTDGSKLLIEKGTPMKEGETKVNFVLFDPFHRRSKEHVTELFEMPVMESALLPELKAALSLKLKEEKQIEVDPNRMRIREMFTKNPSTIYFDSKTLGECSKCLYNGKSLAIQELDEPESKTDEDDVVFFVHQFFPSKYQLGEKLEIKYREETPIDELKQMLSEKFGIKNVGISKAYGNWPGPDVLEIAELEWDRPVPTYSTYSYKTGTLGTAPYYLRDGDIVYFRDNDEELKKLSPEEKKAMEKEVNKTKRTTYYAKEEALTINAKV